MKIKTLENDFLFNLKDSLKEGAYIALGALYVILLSQIEIPLSPIPVTLHTFALMTLAFFQGSKRSLCSVLLYLALATIGFPVFPMGWSDPFWMIAPTAGYFFAFPLAAYVIGKETDRQNNFKTLFSLILGQSLIYGIGVLWLSLYVGFREALFFGLYPFLFTDALKLIAAFSTIKMYSSFRK